MVMTPSTMLPLGTKAPDFDLPSSAKGRVRLSDFSGAKALVVMFICNHCPFVKHVRGELLSIARLYGSKDVAFVAINANDWESFPDDSPEQMALVAKEYHYPFPYLYDETQAVAKAYRAACTPDLFLFDAQQRLVYRGQLDGSRPSNDIPITGKDLRNALDAVLAGRAVGNDQKPSIGCNIKWRAGNEPEYFRT